MNKLTISNPSSNKLSYASTAGNLTIKPRTKDVVYALSASAGAERIEAIADDLKGRFPYLKVTVGEPKVVEEKTATEEKKKPSVKVAQEPAK